MVIALALNVIIFIEVSNAQTCIGGGALRIESIPALENFGSATVSGSPATVTHNYGTSVLFEDMRGTTPGGFTLSISATDFTSENNDIIDVTALKVESDNADTLGLEDCDGSAGVTVSLTTKTAFVGTSENKTLFVGDNRARVGKYSFEPSFSLDVPAYTTPGTYKTTLSFNII